MQRTTYNLPVRLPDQSVHGGLPQTGVALTGIFLRLSQGRGAILVAGLRCGRSSDPRARYWPRVTEYGVARDAVFPHRCNNLGIGRTESSRGVSVRSRPRPTGSRMTWGAGHYCGRNVASQREGVGVCNPVIQTEVDGCSCRRPRVSAHSAPMGMKSKLLVNSFYEQ